MRPAWQRCEGAVAADSSTEVKKAGAKSDGSADPGFVHLHVHSSYSLLEGAMTIGKLADLAKADRQPALALTDTDNMFGALEFSDKLAGSVIQAIIVCALSVDCGHQEAPRHPGHHVKLPRLVLLAAS